jgi:hypothetical protein
MRVTVSSIDATKNTQTASGAAAVAAYRRGDTFDNNVKRGLDEERALLAKKQEAEADAQRQLNETRTKQADHQAKAAETNKRVQLLQERPWMVLFNDADATKKRSADEVREAIMEHANKIGVDTSDFGAFCNTVETLVRELTFDGKVSAAMGLSSSVRAGTDFDTWLRGKLGVRVSATSEPGVQVDQQAAPVAAQSFPGTAGVQQQQARTVAPGELKQIDRSSLKFITTLAQGGFGKVSLMEFSAGGITKNVAVKSVINNTKKARDDLLNEAKLQYRLKQHPNIGLLHGVIETQLAQGAVEIELVMDYYELSLSKTLHGDKKYELMSWEKRARIGGEIASALSYLHESNIIRKARDECIR